MNSLAHDIQAFCNRHAMPVTKFGLLALNDKAFVSSILGGRECLPRTERKVRAFMETYLSSADLPEARAA